MLGKPASPFFMQQGWLNCKSAFHFREILHMSLLRCKCAVDFNLIDLVRPESLKRTVFLHPALPLLALTGEINGTFTLGWNILAISGTLIRL